MLPRFAECPVAESLGLSTSGIDFAVLFQPGVSNVTDLTFKLGGSKQAST